MTHQQSHHTQAVKFYETGQVKLGKLEGEGDLKMLDRGEGGVVVGRIHIQAAGSNHTA
jgi:hypothetical protein